MVEQQSSEWSLRYLFHAAEAQSERIEVLLRQPLSQVRFPSISDLLYAADWHEREAEDLFEIAFDGMEIIP